MTSLFICSKLESLTAKEMVKMEVPDMGMSTPVQRLYELVSQNLHVDACEFELVGYGRILNPAQTLAYYGIRSSSVVYVFRKRNTENLIRRRDPAAAAEQASAEPMSQSEVHRIVVALRTALVNPEFRKIIDRLSEREHQENLMSVTPGLREDPIAMAILQDFDMLNLCTEHDNISKVMHKHPSLATAATFLAAEFHEQHSSADIFRRSPRSAYSLDEDVDDDEEDEAEAAAYSAAASSSARVGNPNLAQLLREALANANANRPLSDAGASTSRAGQRQVTPSSQPAPVNTTTDAASSNLLTGSDASGEPPTRITPEMLQLALNSVRPAADPAPPASGPVAPAAVPATGSGARVRERRDWTRELQQMREMGISDAAVCEQALEATNGDVQLALNIIFNQ